MTDWVDVPNTPPPMTRPRSRASEGGGPEPKPFRWNVPDPAAPGLALKPNGPVRVAGRVPIEAEGTDPLTEDRISLCRCGASRSQPVCDGSHKIVGYREPLEPEPSPSPQPGV